MYLATVFSSLPSLHLADIQHIPSPWIPPEEPQNFYSELKRNESFYWGCFHRTPQNPGQKRPEDIHRLLPCETTRGNWIPAASSNLLTFLSRLDKQMSFRRDITCAKVIPKSMVRLKACAVISARRYIDHRQSSSMSPHFIYQESTKH